MLTFAVSHPQGEGVITFEVFEEGGETVCGVYHLAGHLDLPPHEWLGVVRQQMAAFEDKAREAGIAEMRLAGRDWSRVFPDYEPLAGVTPNLLRKRLSDGR